MDNRLKFVFLVLNSPKACDNGRGWKERHHNRSTECFKVQYILYSTGNSTQYSVMAYMGKESKKEWIYVYV